MDHPQLIGLYRAMYTARQVDLAEQQLSSRGEAFFHLSGAGHEGTAALASHLTPHDWLHCHYRSRALLLARGLSIRSFFDSLLCKDASSSRGRRMSAFFSDPKLNLLSMVTPVGNNALQSVGVAAAVKNRSGKPIVVCGLGDGTAQQGEFLEACGEAARRKLPVLFLIEDNKWAISTPTEGQTFFSGSEPSSQFHGIPIHRIDGRHVVDAHRRLGEIVGGMRHDRQPAIVVCEVDRLASHTNADDHNIYRSEQDLRRAAETGDPITVFEQHLLEHGTNAEQLERIQQEVVRKSKQPTRRA